MGFVFFLNLILAFYLRLFQTETDGVILFKHFKFSRVERSFSVGRQKSCLLSRAINLPRKRFQFSIVHDSF